MGAVGFDTDFGYGRLNACQHCLTHAYSNKSITYNTTSINSQRKIVRDGSGDYHIFSYFRRGSVVPKDFSGDWQTPIKMSYVMMVMVSPSISLGSPNRIMVVDKDLMEAVMMYTFL